MQKWHIHSCIGRGRPLHFPLHPNSAFALSRHHFNTSSLAPQNAGQDTVAREPSSPPPTRAERLQHATTSMEDLFFKHATSDNRTQGQPAPPQFRSIPVRNPPNRSQNASNSSPISFREGSAGVPLGRAVLEGSENTPSFRKLQNTVTGQPRIRSEVLDVSPAAMEARMGATIEGGGERGGFKGVKYAYAGAGDANTRAPTAGAVDTKNMGSTRLERPTRDSHRSAEAFATGAVDARNLGARPEGVGSSLMRNLRRTPSERIGLEEKQRFPPRPEGESRSDHPRNSSGYQGQVPRREDGIRSDQPRSEDGTQQRQSLPQRREDDLNTDHASSEDHIQERTSRFVRDSLRRDGRFRNDQPRSGSGIQERAPQREGQGRAAFNRAPIGDGPPQRRGRPGRPRTARHGDGDGEPKRRKASNFKENRRGKGDRDARLSEPVWDEEEKEYFKQKTKAETQKSLEFDPGNITQQTFSGVAPALVSGIQGMSEVLIERLMLAKRYLEGGFIQWDSKEQRADVMTLVERLKTLDEQGQHDNDGKKGEPLLLRTEDQTQALMQKLLGGKYEMVKPQQGKDVLANVARHVDRNESYFPDDQRSLLEKVRSILPMEGTRSTGKSAKQAAEERCIIEPTWHR